MIQIPQDLLSELKSARKGLMEATDALNDAVGTRTTFMIGELTTLFENVEKAEVHYQAALKKIRQVAVAGKE